MVEKDPFRWWSGDKIFSNRKEISWSISELACVLLPQTFVKIGQAQRNFTTK